MLLCAESCLEYGCVFWVGQFKQNVRSEERESLRRVSIALRAWMDTSAARLSSPVHFPQMQVLGRRIEKGQKAKGQSEKRTICFEDGSIALPWSILWCCFERCHGVLVTIVISRKSRLHGMTVTISKGDTTLEYLNGSGSSGYRFITSRAGSVSALQ